VRKQLNSSKERYPVWSGACHKVTAMNFRKLSIALVLLIIAEYQGQEVYFVPQRCCDVMSVVYRSDGAVMCHPDGGLNGKGDGRCADFSAERRNERIIWRDSKR
jgi:hypothetical protein